MEIAGLRRSYVAALVVPALLLNALTLALALSSAAGDSELLAEVEVVSELCDSVGHDRVCLVRVERLVKGKSDSRVLRVRFPHGMLPEGLGLAGRRHLAAGLTVGERLFVALRREPRCGYSVQHYWVGSATRAQGERTSAAPTAAG